VVEVILGLGLVLGLVEVRLVVEVVLHVGPNLVWSAVRATGRTDSLDDAAADG
jgi:hypothetical protein